MRRTSATLLSALTILLVTAGVPMGVTADNGQGQPDGLVVVAEPRYAATSEGQVVMTPMEGFYVFDVTTYTATGAPYLFTQWGAVLTSIDPADNSGDVAPGACLPEDAALCVWSGGGSTAATNTMTVAVPSAAMAWGAAVPAHGVSFWFIINADGNGDTNADADGRLPSGAFSVLANQYASQGDWVAADQADEGFTPVLMLNTQPSGVIASGSPVINGGFEAGAIDLNQGSTPLEMLCPPCAARPAAAAGWTYERTKTGAPAPSTTTGVALGTTGFALRLDLDATDNNLHPSGHWEGISVGQNYGATTTSHGWTFTRPGTVTVTMDVWSDSPVEVGQTLHVVLPGGASHPEVPPRITVAGDEAWHRVAFTYDVGTFGPGPKGGKINVGELLTHLAFNVNTGATGGGDATILIDNVAMTADPLDVLSFDGTDVRGDYNDGYAMDIAPMGLTGSDLQGVVQGVFTTPSGTYRLYEMAAIDYGTVTPRVVPVSEWTGGAAGAVFQYRDEDEAFATDPIARVDGGYKFVGEERVLVAVPTDIDLSTASPLVAVWGLAPLGDTYTNPFCGAGTSCNQPVPGFYSAVKQAVLGLSIADNLDYALTPVRLSSDVAGDFSFALGLGVPAAGSGTFAVPVTSTAPVLETVPVTFYPGDGSPAQTVVVQVGRGAPAVATFTGAFGSPGDTVVVPDSTFSVGDLVKEGTPVADFAILPPCAGTIYDTNVCNPIVFDDLSADLSLDPASKIVRWAWSFGDGATRVINGGTTGDTTHYYTAPGTYTVTLTVTDNDGYSDTHSKTVTIENAAPIAALKVTGLDPSDPTKIVAGTPALLRPTGTGDPSVTGSLSLLWTVKDAADAVLFTTTIATPQYTFPLPGTYTVSLSVTDNLGLSATASKTITALDPAPVVTPAPVRVIAPALVQPVRSDALVGETVQVGATARDAAGSPASFTLGIVGPSGPVTPTAGGGGGAPPAGPGWVSTISATFVPNEAGTYTVTYTATDDGGSTDTKTQTVTVRPNAAPIAILGASSQTPEIGQTVVFSMSTSSDADAASDAGRGIREYRFDGNGDGDFDDPEDLIGTGTVFTRSFDVAGARTVGAQVVDHLGVVSPYVSLPIHVDDHIVVTLDVPDAAGRDADGVFLINHTTGLVEYFETVVTVVDDTGAPVALADGLLAYEYRPVSFSPVDLPGPVSTFEARDGEAAVRVRPIVSADAGPVKGTVTFLPGMYEVRVTMKAPSRPDGVGGVETATAIAYVWIAPGPADTPI